MLPIPAFLQDDDVRQVLEILTAGGGEVRAIGGAIRNTLLNLPVNDVDIATTLHPQQVVDLATAAGLGQFPLSMEHGIVGLIIGNSRFEIATLRRDVATDGRHATVVFGSSWKEDAERRDFTINAVSMDAGGSIYDYTGGLDDLKSRRVRFIGDANRRIHEDYLRAMRFFRFHAAYGRGDYDQDAWEACAANIAGISTLSPERIRMELLKILVGRNAADTIAAMVEVGLLREALPPFSFDVPNLRRAIEVETHRGRAADPFFLLAAALHDTTHPVLIGYSLRLSGGEDVWLRTLIEIVQTLDDLSVDSAKEVFFHHGRAVVDAVISLRWALDGGLAGDTAKYEAILSDIGDWQPPEFPIRGRDLIAVGVKPGPAMGQMLEQFKRDWIDDQYPTDPQWVEDKLSGFASPEPRP